MNRQRRMSMSRRMLNRRIRVEIPPKEQHTVRPLSDAETQELCEHDVDQFLKRRPEVDDAKP